MQTQQSCFTTPCGKNSRGLGNPPLESCFPLGIPPRSSSSTPGDAGQFSSSAKRFFRVTAMIQLRNGGSILLWLGTTTVRPQGPASLVEVWVPRKDAAPTSSCVEGGGTRRSRSQIPGNPTPRWRGRSIRENYLLRQ